MMLWLQREKEKKVDLDALVELSFELPVPPEKVATTPYMSKFVVVMVVGLVVLIVRRLRPNCKRHSVDQKSTTL